MVRFLIARRKLGYCVFYALAMFLLAVGSVSAQPVQRLGALGDSLTDEYAEEGYNYAKSWTEILVDARGLSFGPTAQQAGVGNWGEPRRSGFEDNWARYGATMQEQFNDGAHLGVAEGANSRNVSHVLIWIGGNDFSPWSGVYDPLYNDSYDERELLAWITERLTYLRAMLDTLRPTPARPVLASIMDFSAMPYVVEGYPNVAGRARVGVAMELMRDATRSLAREQGIVFLDLYARQSELFGPANALRSTLLLGNVSIDLRARDSAGSVPTAGWVEDGIHPNTVLQGLIANTATAALNAWGANIAPLSESTILTQAGLSYGGSDTLAGQLSPPTAFVFDLRGPQPDYSLRYFGNGIDTIDRVVIPLDAPARPVDVGASSFTVEFWIKANLAENDNTICYSDRDSWIYGNIVLDRDVDGPGDWGDWGVALMDGRIAFGVSEGTIGATACGGSPVADGLWHHIALTRNAGSGELRIWRDGVADGSATGPTGDISYRDGRVGQTWDPYLVLGAEKHDYDTLSFSGWLDALRISTGVRYDSAFAPPTQAPGSDASTVALYQFDEGVGNFISDSATASGGPSHGQRRFGGAPAGPLWVTDTPFGSDAIFANGFEAT